MTAQILDGKSLAEQIRRDLARQIADDDGEDMPVLAVVKVGDNEAGEIYVRNKQKAAAEVGMACEVVEFAEGIGEHALSESLQELCANPHINGVIVQLPLPQHLDSEKILQLIPAEKDVDGFGEVNIGRLVKGDKSAIIAATPKGIMRLLAQAGVELSGKKALVIGRSNIVGKPVAMLLLAQNCTVTIAHSKTQNLAALASEADIIVAACGKAKMVKKEWVKQGAIVIDVGINRDENGKLCGDVDFEEVKEKAAFITPVPKGVGPMTVAMLLENTWEAYRQQKDNHHHCECGYHEGHCHCNGHSHH